jgi:superfamily II DNA or RNA helicase
VLFTVPRISLVTQTIDEFEREGITGIGAIQANHPRTDPSAPLQVATVQSLGRRGAPPASLFIVDECHERSAAIEDLMRRRPECRFIGLSATPWAQGMGLVWEDLVRPASLSDLIGAGRVAPFRVCAPDVPDLRGVRVRSGEFVDEDLQRVMSGRALVANVVATWLAKGEDRPTFVFCVNRAHAAHLHAQFESASISSAYVDLRTDHIEIDVIQRKFAAGAIRVVCSVIKLSAGINWPQVSCIVDAAPTRSEMRHVQKIGRGLRLHPGKADCLILDHAGNSLRLGLVTDIESDRLDTTPRGEKMPRASVNAEKQPRTCVECGALHTGPICPACGHVRRPGSSGVKTLEGELVELARTAKASVPDAAAQARFYGMALGHARYMGYSPGWAAHKFHENFGHWPDGLPGHPVEPDRPFLNWIKSRRIAWAKARAKDQNHVSR